MGNIVVCLDAGHAGKYNQSPVAPKFYESEINWKLQKLLAKKLEEYGIRTRMTKSTPEEDPNLTARGRKAKDCDLFVSLHVNAADDPDVNYVLGIHMVDDNCGQIDEKSYQIAKLLADCVADILGAEAQIWTKRSSVDSEADYYGVLRGAHSVGTAGVIIEHGFYTNKQQAEFLLKDSNLEKIAEAEAKVIAEYFGIGKQQRKMATLQLPVLNPGDSGETVKAMQTLLENQGYKLKRGATGNYGESTKAALLQFKKDKGLKVSDLCGVQTWAALLGVNL